MHPLYKHMRKAKRYVKRHRTPLHELLHTFQIDPDRLETISTHWQKLGWIRQVGVKKAVNKEVAYREEMQSTMRVKVYMDGLDIKGGEGAAALLIRDGLWGLFSLFDWSLYYRDFVHTCLWHNTQNSTDVYSCMDMLYRCYLLYSTYGPTLCGSSLCNLLKYAPVRAHTVLVY